MNKPARKMFIIPRGLLLHQRQKMLTIPTPNHWFIPVNNKCIYTKMVSKTKAPSDN